MTRKSISMSFLLAIALGLTACGGGGGTTPSVKPSGDTKVDKSAPVFSSNIPMEYRVEEETALLDIATIEVTDESPVAFALTGADAEYFELVESKTREAYSKTLKFKETPDYEEQPSYTVTVVVTDSAGNSSEKTFTVDLENKPFAFDTTGNMGSVEEEQNATLPLATEEGVGNVTYSLSDNTNFQIIGNELVFTAPIFNSAASNRYDVNVTATDESGASIVLPVTVNVIPFGGEVVKTNYYVKRQRDIDSLGAYTDYEYTYDIQHYLIKVVKTGTNINGQEITKFEYSVDQNHIIMRGYEETGSTKVLKSIRVFEKKNTKKEKFAASIETRLSADESVNFMSYVYDSAALQNNMHLTKYIYGLKYGQKFVEQYVYNNNDQLTRMIKGKYLINADQVKALSDTQLYVLSAPSGGFPSGDKKLTSTQLNSLATGSMPIDVSQETTFVYTKGKLTGRRLFEYDVENKDRSDDVTLTYYPSHVLKEIVSGGVSIKYDTSSLLESTTIVQNNQRYILQYGYKRGTFGEQQVTVKNGNKTLITYIFEEE